MKKLEEMSRNEKMVRQLVIGFRNEYVGGLENSYSDYGEEQFIKDHGYITKKEVEDYIYNEIMNGKQSVIMHPYNGWGMEKKHIKFLGEQFIRELIDDRVTADYEKNGWSFPNRYEKEVK